MILFEYQECVFKSSKKFIPITLENRMHDTSRYQFFPYINIRKQCYLLLSYTSNCGKNEWNLVR